jgi:BirA family transcriptional regulator, biotin operon repressor / biotin---[acetyl-CoA-carboxylase] ligase
MSEQPHPIRFAVEWLESVPSTNRALRARLADDPSLPAGTLLAAREQTAGRGRAGRSWHSRRGAGLVFSFLIPAPRDAARAPSVTMAAALAVDDALQAAGIESRPKWPNDVLVRGRKICGILAEAAQGAAPGLIVGVGLNVNLSEEEAASIGRPATSMLIETGRARDLEGVLEALLPALGRWIAAWTKAGFGGLRDAWILRAGEVGRPISVHEGQTRVAGTVAGYGDAGQLVLCAPDGRLCEIWSGDVDGDGSDAACRARRPWYTAGRQTNRRTP